MKSQSPSSRFRLKLVHKLILLLCGIMILVISGTTIVLLNNLSKTTTGMLAKTSDLNNEIQKKQGGILQKMQKEQREQFSGIAVRQDSAFEKVGKNMTTSFEEITKSQSQTAEKALKTKAQGMTDLIAKVSAIALSTFNFDALNEYCQAACNDSEILMAMIFDKENRPLASQMRVQDQKFQALLSGAKTSKPEEVYGKLKGSSHVITVERDIRSETGEVSGRVSLLVHTGAIQEQRQRIFADLGHIQKQMKSEFSVASQELGTGLQQTQSVVESGMGALKTDIQKASEDSKTELGQQKDIAVNDGIQKGLAVGIASIAASLILFLLVIVRAMFKPIRMMGAGLNESANTVASATTELVSVVHSLAEGAASQAASIEETSSSLEEMNAMTKQNAENAAQGDALMKETRQVVEEASTVMGKLIRSIEEISKASEETSKIIKTIDDIAFQTNLLALNAAVEAARAGEAGAGFAVVADEVRNLALRAAQAAKTTSGLIEGTLVKVKEGSSLVTTTNDKFTEVSNSTSRVEKLVAEIAAASRQQAQGIEQVTKSLAEIERVVQQVASTAEESANACEEMNNQSGQMRGFVGSLVDLVSGRQKDLAVQGNH
jgi:methyl-accepting chemotaxis protein